MQGCTIIQHFSSTARKLQELDSKTKRIWTSFTHKYTPLNLFHPSCQILENAYIVSGCMVLCD